MTIYLHSCTQGTLEICYRGDYTPDHREASQRERQGFKKVKLDPWRHGAIEIPSGADAGNIIGQLQAAGGISYDQLRTLPGTVTASFLYDPLRRPTLSERDDVVKHNRGVKTEEGQRRRLRAALGADQQLTSNLVDRGMPEAMRPPETQVEWEQDADSEQDERGRLEQGFKVKPNADAPRPRPNRRRAA